VNGFSQVGGLVNRETVERQMVENPGAMIMKDDELPFAERRL
jgi:hypothetical protein